MPDDKLTLDDVLALLRRWAAVHAWGTVTIHFSNGAVNRIEPAPVIHNYGDLKTHYPRLGQEMEPVRT